MSSKYGLAIKQIENQDKIICILREQVNTLQGEVINILKNMCEIERDAYDSSAEPKREGLKVRSKGDLEMDVDVDELKESQNVSSLREVTWDECEDESFKELLVFQKDIAVKVTEELKDVSKKFKKRTLDETKGKMGRLGVWLQEKGTEVEKMAGKDINHKNKYENDQGFKEMLTEMSNVMSAVELSTKKEKTRKILEDNLKNLIDGADTVLMNKCTEIWAIFDEMPIELQQVTRTIGK